MTKKTKWAALAALLVVLASSAHAGFVGSTVHVEFLSPTISTSGGSRDVLVGAGAELSSSSLAHVIDLSDSQITFTLPNGGSFPSVAFFGFSFSDLLNNVPNIMGVSVDNSRYLGFNPAGVTFDANDIWVSFSGVTQSGPGTLVLNVSFVPEPDSMALLGLGLAGLMWSRRRRA